MQRNETDYSQMEYTHNQFVWRKEWISPYESLWSIFEKFKYVNCANTNDILNLFGTDYVVSLKSKVTGRKHRNCLSLTGIDNDRVKSAFLQPIIEINQTYMDKLIGSLPNEIHPHNYIRGDLYFCPLCIIKGFHSIFHQFKPLKECPYHQIPLQKSCPSCKKAMPFEITDYYTKSPFQCKCGKSLLEEALINSLIPSWEQVPLNKLKSRELKTWLNLNQEQKKKLKSCHLPLFLDLEKCPSFLRKILTVITPEQINTKNHSVVKSAPYIRHLIGKKEKDDAKLKTFYRECNFYDEIYKSSLKTIKSITSHVRKTILMNHRTCIKKLIKGREDEPICPNATAYDYWIRFIYGYEDDFFVSWPKPYRKSRIHLEFASKQDNYYLIELFSTLSFYYENDFKKESRAAIKWIFNRVLSHLIINNFCCWLSMSHELVKRNPRFSDVSYNKIKNFNFPLYVLVIPENRNEPLEFHWWYGINELQNESIKKLVCPYH